MSTFFPSPEDVDRKWYVVDAAGLPIGRVSSFVASILMGKRNPMYTPHLDTGDHVVVINADQVVHLLLALGQIAAFAATRFQHRLIFQTIGPSLHKRVVKIAVLRGQFFTIALKRPRHKAQLLLVLHPKRALRQRILENFPSASGGGRGGLSCHQ